MVRLKDRVGGFRYATSVGFQFLMVRLKVSMFVSVSKFISLFQFLMVRLKAKIVKSHFFYRFISIPYGAIKRVATRLVFMIFIDFNSLWCD